MPESLFTIAEIAVAVVGFIAIVTVLREKSDAGELDLVLTRNIITEPIAVVMLALLPSVLANLNIDLDMNYRLSNFIAALVHLFLTGWIYTRFSPHFGKGMNRILTSTLCVIPVAICVLQLCAAAGYFSDYSFFLYVLGLYWLLGMCFVNFLVLFQRIHGDT